MSSFRGTSLTCSRSRPVRSSPVRAALADLVPGVPPGEDARSFASPDQVVPRPPEDYSSRGFATKLPVTWAGEVGTIGADLTSPAESESKLAKSKQPESDPASDEAFSKYAEMVKAERDAALSALQSQEEVPGRATCGPSEGRALVSNFNMQSVLGVKAIGYWEKWACDEN